MRGEQALSPRQIEVLVTFAHTMVLASALRTVFSSIAGSNQSGTISVCLAHPLRKIPTSPEQSDFLPN
jgi:hypothetical protein